ncbi:MAG: heme ABC transporter ATP-binding protein [Gammaproteobacteria bacterium]
MLVARNLTLQIGAQVLLDDFSAEFGEGEVSIVAGPNGAGKTTLLRCLNGELRPARGCVELARRPLGDWPRAELARHRAALPQDSALDFPFTALDVTLMGRMPHSTSHADNRAIAARALGLCDCAQLAERAYTSLSGGERRRVQIARVLAQIFSPGRARRFLLLDEPAASLDVRHQYELLRLLRELSRAANIGVVCTMHDLNLAAQFADRALLIQNGRLLADGAPREVFTQQLIGGVFGLEAAVGAHPDASSVPLIIPRLRRGHGCASDW